MVLGNFTDPVPFRKKKLLKATGSRVYPTSKKSSDKSAE